MKYMVCVNSYCIYMHVADCPSVQSDDQNSDNPVDDVETDNTSSDIDSDGEKGCNTTKDVDNFLVPSYCNQQDVDDMYALKWGLHHYMKYFPRMKRPPYTKYQ